MIKQKTLEKSLTPTEVSRMLKVSRQTVYRLLKSGKLPAVYIPGVGYRVRENELYKLIDQGENKLSKFLQNEADNLLRLCQPN